MSLKIEVIVPPDVVVNNDAGAYVARALAALGYARQETRSLPADQPPVTGLPQVDMADAGPVSVLEEPDVAKVVEAAKRERGKPSAGRARRTKEEIAEDEAADKADGAAPDRQISTAPENRVEPTDPPAAQEQEQDAADEKAEAEQVKQAELSHDDVRKALGAYVGKYGMAAAQEDGPKVIALLFGEGKAKVSDVPATQDALRKAVDGVEEMTVKNPFKREAVG